MNKEQREKALQKILWFLNDKHIKYFYAQQLAKLCGISKSSIYSLIKEIRLRNIGIIVTKKGYILSSRAEKKDDLNYIRFIYGRRASDYIAAKAAESDIYKRWKGEINDKNFRSMYRPLIVDISQGMRVLLTEVKRQENLAIKIG